MFELLLIIALCVGMWKVAEQEDLSGPTWGTLTFAICIGSMLIPLPFVRVIVAGVVVFGIMLAYNIKYK